MSKISEDITRLRMGYFAKYRTIPESIQIKKSVLQQLYPVPVEPKILFPMWPDIVLLQQDFYNQEVIRREKWLADPKFYKGMRVEVIPETEPHDFRFIAPDDN